MEKVIRIRCESSAGRTLTLDQMKPIQKGLKRLTTVNFDKLYKRIAEKGYKEPISIWEHKGENIVLSGTQRHRVMSYMVEKDGWKCGPLPVNIVFADSLKEAMDDLLGLAASYGEVVGQELYEFMETHGINPALLTTDVTYQNMVVANFMDEYYNDNVPDPMDLALQGANTAANVAENLGREAKRSGTRMIQIFFTEEVAEEFLKKTVELGQQWDIDNISDTLKKAVELANE